LETPRTAMEREGKAIADDDDGTPGVVLLAPLCRHDGKISRIAAFLPDPPGYAGFRPRRAGVELDCARNRLVRGPALLPHP
ncbi:hypothetical protein DF186_23255, partial [Enterococcus hirae]